MSILYLGFPGGISGKNKQTKNFPVNAGDIGDVGLIPGSGRSLAGGNDNPFKYFCLENPMDRGAWWTIIRGVAKSHT